MMKNRKMTALLIAMLVLIASVVPVTTSYAAGWNFKMTEGENGTYDKGIGGDYQLTAWAEADNLVNVTMDGNTIAADNYTVTGSTVEDENEGEGTIEPEEEPRKQSSKKPAPAPAPTPTPKPENSTDNDSYLTPQPASPAPINETSDASSKESAEADSQSINKLSMVVREVEFVGETYYFTTITFHEDYMRSLSEGEHTIELKFVNGSSKAVVNVTGTTPASAAVPPKTADNSQLTMMLAIVSVSGLAAVYLTMKKRYA